MKTVSNRLLGNAPWWALSAGFHAVLLLGATLVFVERLMEVDGVDYEIHPRAPGQFVDEEYPRDILERKGTLTADRDAELSSQVLFPAFGSPGEDIEDRGSCHWCPQPVHSGKTIPELAFQREGRTPAREHLRPGIGAGYSQRIPSRRLPTRCTSCCGPATEGAVDVALKWLARHQNPDGSWSAGDFGARCERARCSGSGDGAYDTGVTALSVLAFLGAGYSHLSKDQGNPLGDSGPILAYGEVVKRGIRWLADHQDAEGCVGERGPKYLYNHAIAALALSEEFGMTAAEPLRGPAQRAVDFLVAAQNPGKGWRYSAKAGDNDTSVTGWAVMALKSAELSGLTFPRSAFEGAMVWLDEATGKGPGRRTGYTGPGTGRVFVPGRNEQFEDHPTMSAVSILSRCFIRKSKADAAPTSAPLLAADLPSWSPGKVDFYYWYYASLALYQVDGPKGPTWQKWNEPMKLALVPHQKVKKDGCENGSWDPAEDRWGFEGGRVYATALNCMTLEVYYRYESVFGATAR